MLKILFYFLDHRDKIQYYSTEYFQFLMQSKCQGLLLTVLLLMVFIPSKILLYCNHWQYGLFILLLFLFKWVWSLLHMTQNCYISQYVQFLFNSSITYSIENKQYIPTTCGVDTVFPSLNLISDAGLNCYVYDHVNAFYYIPWLADHTGYLLQVQDLYFIAQIWQTRQYH